MLVNLWEPASMSPRARWALAAGIGDAPPRGCLTRTGPGDPCVTLTISFPFVVVLFFHLPLARPLSPIALTRACFIIFRAACVSLGFCTQ